MTASFHFKKLTFKKQLCWLQRQTKNIAKIFHFPGPQEPTAYEILTRSEVNARSDDPKQKRSGSIWKSKTHSQYAIIAFALSRIFPIKGGVSADKVASKESFQMRLDQQTRVGEATDKKIFHG